MTNCDNCEFISSDKVCWAIQLNNQRLCQESYKKIVREKTNNPDTLFDKASSFASSVVKEVTHGVEISQEQVDARLSICKACDLFNSEKNMCSLCGCNMPWKVQFSTARCPLDPPKWGPIE